MKTAFWVAPEYAAVRERLRRPAPVVDVVAGGDVLTFRAVPETERLAAGEPLPTEEGELPPQQTAEVCMLHGPPNPCWH